MRVALLALLLVACGDDDDDHAPAPDAGVDASPESDAGSDAGSAAWGCACEEGETCDECLSNIANCCYEDPTIGGQYERLVGTCERDGACKACCSECAAKSCEELVAAGACPAQPVAPWENGVVMDNGLMQDLATAPLSTEGLASQEGLAGALADPNFHKFMSYVIQCALPADAEVQIGDEVLPGKTGLAPEWADGPCEEACQEWVTACMMSRSNSFAVAVILNATGPHPAMAVDEADAALYPEQEGAFWGNMFLDPPVEYACRGEGRDPLLGTFRVCAQPGNRCGIQYVGPCGAIDGDTGLPSERHACEAFDPVSRSYTRCHDRATLPGSDEFPAGTKTYERVFTTWVAHTAFQEGYADACESADPIAPFAPDDVPGGAGATCDNDDDCAIEDGFHCDARPDRGFCTKACTDSPEPSEEEAECGDEAICTGPLAGEAGFCTASCTPRVRDGDCATGQLCTTGWLMRDEVEPAGCRPFCSSDAECPPNTPCSRFGACGFPVDMNALADGEPCAFIEGTDTPVAPCRGGCFRLGPDPSIGLCVSLINLAVTDDCPDDPNMVTLTQGDDLAICAYRRCDGDQDCTPPTRCIDTARGLLCDHPQ